MNKSGLHAGVRVVAVFEAAKAALVLLAGLGLLTLIHKDVQDVAERIVERFRMNPAHHYPQVFIEAASKVTDARLWMMAGLALLYAIVRLVEAYGLWWNRRWAEWFALVSGGLYIPVEIYEVVHHANWIKVCVLLVNAGIVLYMGYELRRSRGAQSTGEGTEA